jgi:type II secretory pathway pseudopilin PulG
MNVRSKKELTKRGGFTIIELLIVIGVVMALSALVLSGFSNMGANNRRQSCQSNLAQIYQSLRLYQQDEGGFPFFADPGYSESVPVEQNIGLWALYAFPQTDDPLTAANEANIPDPSKALNRYVRSTRVLHCPQDREAANANLFDSSVTPAKFNMKYLSYQGVYNDSKHKDSAPEPQYQSIRVTDPSDLDWKRQLTPYEEVGGEIKRVFRAPADDTIVTWCPYHRPSGRDFDNVLFYDGSVQLIIKNKNGKEGWKRTPKPPL